MATKDDSRFSSLTLIGAYGVKIGGPYDVDIQDLWVQHPAKVTAMKWRDVEKSKRDYASMTDAQLSVIARNTETFARFCWEPYMHNPKLKHRLHRIATPTRRRVVDLRIVIPHVNAGMPRRLGRAPQGAN